jgi:enoyl-CoA hydratase/carnithine racemase
MVQALMCDMRFASDRAKFTAAFSKRGLIAEYGMSWILPRLVGHSAAMDILFSSRIVEADEALALGLVDRVHPADELMARTMEYATRLALDVSPTSMSVMKRQVWADTDKSLGEASDDALALMRESVLRPDFREGVVSFLKKRQPEFPPVDPGA